MRPLYKAVLSFVALVGFAPAGAAKPTFEVIYQFSGTDGAAPGHLTGSTAPTGNFALYGTASFGGFTGKAICKHAVVGEQGCGVVFQLTPPANGQSNWSENPLHIFKDRSDGAFPRGSVTAMTDGTLYGATSSLAVHTPRITGGLYSLVPPGSGQGWSFASVYAFSSAKVGQFPDGGVNLGARGDFFGSARLGGTDDRGTLFQLSQSGGRWKGQAIYNFENDEFGGDPTTSLLADAQGDLYGTIPHGGANGTGGLFELSPRAPGQQGWSMQLIHSMDNFTEGEEPQSPLVADAAGALYGTTSLGGSGFTFPEGTVYRLVPHSGQDWTLTVLHTFGADTLSEAEQGGAPAGPLVVDTKGAVWGVTTVLGDLDCQEGEGCGTVFKLTPPSKGETSWKLTLVHSFTGKSDGGFAGWENTQSGLTLAPDGTIYGATPSGGIQNAGTVFAVTP